MKSSIRQILVPTDFSASSDRALDLAIELASCLGGSIHILYVQPFPIAIGPDTFIYADSYEQEIVAVGLSTRAKRVRDAGVPCEVTSAEGDPADGIESVANVTNPDLVVMGTHGRTGLAKLMFGSVTSRVIPRIHRPVLVVPPLSIDAETKLAESFHP